MLLVTDLCAQTMLVGALTFVIIGWLAVGVGGIGKAGPLDFKNLLLSAIPVSQTTAPRIQTVP